MANQDGTFIYAMTRLTISAAGVDGMSMVDAAANGISFGDSDAHDSAAFLIDDR